jgi:3-oxoacyl-[acyl-carrier-protein] synthase-3
LIGELVAAIPSREADRSWVMREERDSFAKVSGIQHTWQWEGKTVELAAVAVNAVMEKEIGSLVVVTQSPDRSCPSTAVELAGVCGLPTGIPMFDVNQACAGFIYGLWLAYRLPKPCMLVLVDRLRMDQYQPPTSKLIFSDAAAALVVYEDNSGTAPARFFHDPKGLPKLHASREGFMSMDGGAVFDFVIRNVPKLISEYEGAHGPSRLLVQHQANLSMMNWVVKKTGFEGRSLNSIEQYGNMSMVSIPVAIAANEEHACDRTLLLCGYGAGWSAALMKVRWLPTTVSRIVRC